MSQIISTISNNVLKCKIIERNRNTIIRTTAIKVSYACAHDWYNLNYDLRSRPTAKRKRTYLTCYKPRDVTQTVVGRCTIKDSNPWI